MDGMYYKDSLYELNMSASFRVALFKVGHAVAVGMECFLVLSVLGKRHCCGMNCKTKVQKNPKETMPIGNVSFLQWTLINGITLGQTITDPKNQMITRTEYIY
jgi:hypothetical protein